MSPPPHSSDRVLSIKVFTHKCLSVKLLWAVDVSGGGPPFCINQLCPSFGIILELSFSSVGNGIGNQLSCSLDSARLDLKLEIHIRAPRVTGQVGN